MHNYAICKEYNISRNGPADLKQHTGCVKPHCKKECKLTQEEVQLGFPSFGVNLHSLFSSDNVKTFLPVIGVVILSGSMKSNRRFIVLKAV